MVPAEKNLVDISKLSTCLGISKSTIYSWTAGGKIPHLKVGKHLRFDLDEVLAYFRDLTPEQPGSCKQLQKSNKKKAQTRSLKTKGACRVVPLKKRE